MKQVYEYCAGLFYEKKGICSEQVEAEPRRP